MEEKSVIWTWRSTKLSSRFRRRREGRARFRAERTPPIRYIQGRAGPGGYGARGRARSRFYEDQGILAPARSGALGLTRVYSPRDPHAG